jgi:hypothetical protein
MEDLTAIVARNPDALKSVDRFTVGQAGVGSIMYLEDVDLSGIDDLEDVFFFELGSVSAYYNGCKVKKAPVGQGLNHPARVQIELSGKQMNSIMRRKDSHSSEEYLSQLKLRLRSMTAQMDATFIDLQVKSSTRSVWVFEVQHFSRCVSAASHSLPNVFHMLSLMSDYRCACDDALVNVCMAACCTILMHHAPHIAADIMYCLHVPGCGESASCMPRANAYDNPHANRTMVSHLTLSL